MSAPPQMALRKLTVSMATSEAVAYRDIDFTKAMAIKDRLVLMRGAC